MGSRHHAGGVISSCRRWGETCLIRSARRHGRSSAISPRYSSERCSPPQIPPNGGCGVWTQPAVDALNLACGSRFVQVVSSDELKFTFEIWMELFCRQNVSVK